MSYITIFLSALVALEHLYIMFLETIATSSGATSRTFGMSREALSEHQINTLFKNQGVYNGLLAVLLAIALWQGDILWTRLLLGYVILVAVYGSMTSNPKIILKQGGLAVLALVSTFF